MARVVFYESAAYPHSASQKERLIALGHEVESFDLMNEPWSVSSLRPFFGSKPVREWFNPSASRVVSGEINLERITPQSALVEMILDPALINGPLMRIGIIARQALEPSHSCLSNRHHPGSARRCLKRSASFKRCLHSFF